MATQQPDTAPANTAKSDVAQQSSDLEARLSRLEQRVERLAGVMRKLVEGMQGKSGETNGGSGDEVPALVARIDAMEKRLSTGLSFEAVATNGTRTVARNADILADPEKASHVSAQLARSTEHLSELRRTRVRSRKGKRRSTEPSRWRRLAQPRYVLGALGLRSNSPPD